MVQKNNLTIQVVSILGGVLSAIFFLGFLILTSIMHSDISYLIVGSLLIIATISVSRLVVKPFLDAMNITLYIAGCALIGYGFNNDIDTIFITFLGVSILTFLLSKGVILPFLAVILFNISLFREISYTFSWKYPLEIAVVPIMAAFLLTTIFETKLLTLTEGISFKYKPFHTGLYISSFFVLSGLSINFFTTNINIWMISVFIWIGLFFMIYRIMKVMEIKNRVSLIGIYILCILICVPTIFAPYLSGSLLLILICFHYGYKAECAASLLLFMYAISKYYYDLNLSLLVKSITLFFIGITFLVAWYYFTQKKSNHEKI